MTKQRFHAAYTPPAARRDDINYPGAGGIPGDGGDMTQRQTSRATVDYDTYVLQYAARQRGHVLMAASGIVAAIGAAIYLDGTALVLVAAGAVGFTVAGLAGFAVAADAHAGYTRDLAVSVSETWERRPTPPAPKSPRVFVPSENPRTIRTGRLTFAPTVWQSLLDNALGNGGIVTRDGAKGAGVGRDWYHAAGYGNLLIELNRLGFIDERNRATDRWLTWYDEQYPALPLAAFPQKRAQERTNGERTGANDVLEWGE